MKKLFYDHSTDKISSYKCFYLEIIKKTIRQQKIGLRSQLSIYQLVTPN